MLRGAGFLHEVHLTPGNGGGGNEGAVLGADEGQVALGYVSSVLGRFELALEATHPGHALVGHALLCGGGKKNDLSERVFETQLS